MRCGHGWEQAYEIEHHVDAEGRPFVVYLAGGKRVPSPLTRPNCTNCGGHVVRIMRSGQVRSFAGRDRQPPAGPLVPAQDLVTTEASADAPAATGRHWHLSDLLHPFRNRHRE
ncbi:hypothetical protein [Streptomyces sp. XD-27]|uniref:hypothetical protein n=1 Tax=Streptomyces sp. XD-27 TaxID=3062779 RepID=UPI0026F4101D|nr:hypothetical protein [Streptomyces sp. XD-27]WKX72231.1 hypothetical protein Q3Y56_22085 [Streptomyces sp. XD-27]